MATAKKKDRSLGVDSRLAKWVGILIGEIFVLALTGYFLLLPRLQELIKMRSDLSKQQEIVMKLDEKAGALEDFQIDTGRKYSFVVNEVFLSEKNLTILLGSLLQLSNQAGVQILKYSLRPGTIFDTSPEVIRNNARLKVTYEPINLDITVFGSSAGVTNYLGLLDKSLPLKEVKNIGISASQGSDGTSFELSVELSFFELPISAAVNAEELLTAITSEDIVFAETLATYTRYTATATESAVPSGNQNLFGL